METVLACQWQKLVFGGAEFMESSGACNLKGAVSREAAIAAPIIKLLWSPALEGEEGREKTQARRGGLGHEEIFLAIHAKK